MATIIVLEHALQRSTGISYMSHLFARFWRDRGHRVFLQCGSSDPPSGDLAVMHVDLTVVPPAYAALARLYPRTINAAVTDISKRLFRGDDILSRHSDWRGQVIVKTNANFGGRVDQYIRDCQVQAGMEPDVPPGPVLADYPIYATLAEVPPAYWETQDFVVEKFTPESDERGNYMRVWVFLGDRERSMRYRSAARVVKSANFIDAEPVEVPAELREWRSRLGFDMGKFDYVIHQGRVVLLDINRSPGSPPAGMPGILDAYREMAAGVEHFLA